MKPNNNQTPDSQSAQVNHAAKDVTVQLADNHAGGFTFTEQQLLANDPGSAAFDSAHLGSLPAGVTYDVHTHVFTVAGPGVDLNGFDYTIRIANGTFSTAHATFSPHEGSSLFADGFSTYELSNINTSGTAWWGTANLADNGWTVKAGSGSTEIVHDGYQGIVGPDADSFWLDTQGSPGGIDISHVVTDANGGKAEITLTLGIQQFDNWLSLGTLNVIWNGVVVDPISLSSFSTVANGEFEQFSVVVNSNVGVNTLELQNTGVSFVGFALDSVQVHDWVY